MYISFSHIMLQEKMLSVVSLNLVVQNPPVVQNPHWWVDTAFFVM